MELEYLSVISTVASQTVLMHLTLSMHLILRRVVLFGQRLALATA